MALLVHCSRARTKHASSKRQAMTVIRFSTRASLPERRAERNSFANYVKERMCTPVRYVHQFKFFGFCARGGT